ncbi:hypothetical protein BJ508DRAFT_95737 [Ascobolus immersus RN42]|uniref:F-box domain-containing protein n=1 Tax=Ascobolus immersus RN42 TaxID=1160509 RepID=A0A3N4IQQ5_ASCIM|nr:hypothetical protein BJ508DRAFT_95737 [Ascobolus immersus RN42]
MAEPVPDPASSSSQISANRLGLHELPAEIRYEIYSYLSIFTLLQLSHTCRTINADVNNHMILNHDINSRLSICKTALGFRGYGKLTLERPEKAPLSMDDVCWIISDEEYELFKTLHPTQTKWPVQKKEDFVAPDWFCCRKCWRVGRNRSKKNRSRFLSHDYVCSLCT